MKVVGFGGSSKLCEFLGSGFRLTFGVGNRFCFMHDFAYFILELRVVIGGVDHCWFLRKFTTVGGEDHPVSGIFVGFCGGYLFYACVTGYATRELSLKGLGVSSQQ